MARELMLNPTERRSHFIQWCGEKGIKRFLFDLDDTICSTRLVFREVMSQAFDYLASAAPQNNSEKWKEEVEAINNRLFEEMGVNPNRWNLTVDELAKKHLLDDEVALETKRIFQSIYTSKIAIKEHAVEGLGFVQSAGVPIGVVTHAGEKWTWRKYEWLNLGRFVDKSDFFLVDEDGHKTSESWTEAITFFGLTPNQVAVVGDSPRSDINPAWEVGVKHCFLVEDEMQWSVHKQPVHQDVKKIKHLNQIVEAILY